jgi:hypothetical protein
MTLRIEWVEGLYQLLPIVGFMSEALMKNTLWRNSALFSVTFILFHSASLWFHPPPAACALSTDWSANSACAPSPSGAHG